MHVKGERETRRRRQRQAGTDKQRASERETARQRLTELFYTMTEVLARMFVGQADPETLPNTFTVSDMNMKTN